MTEEIVGGDRNRIADFRFLDEAVLPVEDEDANYPAGLVSVTLCSDDGDLTDGDPCDGIPPCVNGTVKVTFENFAGTFDSPAFQYRFFDPAGNDYAALPNADLMGNMATLTLSDGGTGDTSDTPLAATSGTGGRIQDTGGPGLLQLAAPAPAMPLSGLALALMTLLGIGGWTLRRKR